MNSTGLIIDAVLIGIIIFNILTGRSKGFIGVIATLICSIIGLAIAKAYAEPVAQWINDNLIHERLVDYFAGILQANLSKGSDAAVSAIPDYLVSAASQNGISLGSIIGNSFSSVDVGAISLKLASATETIISPLISGIGYALVFIAFKFASSFIIGFIATIFKLPVLKQTNRLLGAAFGAVKGFIIVLIVCGLLSVCQSIFVSSELTQAISSSSIVHIFGETLTGLILN